MENKEIENIKLLDAATCEKGENEVVDGRMVDLALILSE